MKAATRIKPFLRHLFTAGNAHSIHSPFVFELYTKVLKGQDPTEDLSDIELLRSKLKQDDRSISVTDFGSGKDKNPTRKVRDIARACLKSPKEALLLYKLASYFKPATIVELGTSLGITSLYLSKACPDAQIFTFEGCHKILSLAEENFRQYSSGNIHTVSGNIDTTLPVWISQHKSIDLAYLDANHQYGPTMKYFSLLLEKAGPQSVFILDDIYWSPEMTKAWEEIKQHQAVRLTVDLFHFGMVFFRPNAPKQHFRLRV